MYYANEESDDVLGGSIKTVHHPVKNMLGSITGMFFKLGNRNVYHKGKKNDTHCAITMTTVMLLVLFKLRLKFSDFIFTRIIHL